MIDDEDPLVDDDYLTEWQFRALDLGSLTPEEAAEAIDRYELGLRVDAERQAAWRAEHAGEVWFGHVIGGNGDEVATPAQEPEIVDDESQYQLDLYLDLWPVGSELDDHELFAEEPALAEPDELADAISRVRARNRWFKPSTSIRRPG